VCEVKDTHLLDIPRSDDANCLAILCGLESNTELEKLEQEAKYPLAVLTSVLPCSRAHIFQRKEKKAIFEISTNQCTYFLPNGKLLKYRCWFTDKPQILFNAARPKMVV
jgi:hypothetical protein